MRLLLEAYPEKPLSDTQIELYTSFLLAAPYEPARSALFRLLSTQKWLPKIAEWREAMGVVSLPSPAEDPEPLPEEEYDPTDTTYTWLAAFSRELGRQPEPDWFGAINALRGFVRGCRVTSVRHGEHFHCRDVPVLCVTVRSAGCDPTPSAVWEFAQRRQFPASVVT